MWIIVLGLLILSLIVCVPFRIIFFKPLKAGFYAVKDFIGFIIHRQFQYADCGFIIAYCGLFGKGKTLSCVDYVVRYFHRYNNRRVWDKFRKKYVTQIVNVISNVHLQIPYTEFVSLSQIVDVAEQVQQINEENDVRILTIVLGDEFSVQLNSRNFKSNLDPLTLSSILTCRHHGISLVYTAQRFQHVDALLRQVTERVIECKKMWRCMVQNYFDAWQLENASSSLNIKPIKRGGFLIRDQHYNQYDSIATVNNLIKDYRAGNMISEERILQLQGRGPDQPYSPRSKKRKKEKVPA